MRRRRLARKLAALHPGVSRFIALCARAGNDRYRQAFQQAVLPLLGRLRSDSSYCRCRPRLCKNTKPNFQISILAILDQQICTELNHNRLNRRLSRGRADRHEFLHGLDPLLPDGSGSFRTATIPLVPLIRRPYVQTWRRSSLAVRQNILGVRDTATPRCRDRDCSTSCRPDPPVANQAAP
jgi:hypothetical protein